MFTEDEKRILLYSLLESRSKNEEFIFNHKEDIQFLKEVEAAEKYIKYHESEIEEEKQEIEKIDKLYKKISGMELQK